MYSCRAAGAGAGAGARALAFIREEAPALTAAALQVLQRRESNHNKRLYAWLLGQGACAPSPLTLCVQLRALLFRCASTSMCSFSRIRTHTSASPRTRILVFTYCTRTLSASACCTLAAGSCALTLYASRTASSHPSDIWT